MSGNSYSIECPHCGESNESAEDAFQEPTQDYDGNKKNFKCESCGKEYKVTLHIEISYSTSKI